MSKSKLEAQVTSTFLHPTTTTTDNHTSTTTTTVIENVLVTISGEKNSMKLMAEFGFLPAIAGSNLTAAEVLAIGKAEGGDGICAGAVMMLSNKFWFFDSSSSIDSQTKPFRFAGGCILPPYDLVLKYQRVNQTSLETENEKALGEEEEADTCGQLDGVK
jgi:hypothetical protein